MRIDLNDIKRGEPLYIVLDKEVIYFLDGNEVRRLIDKARELKNLNLLPSLPRI